MTAAIKVENLSKLYRIGAHQMRGYRTLRETLSGGIAASLKALRNGPRVRRNATDDPQSFWALDNVSVKIQPGEAVGIIGGNGAGKSTLLKVLSRITEPTRGRAFIRGRIASLLEVGTGFHNELTGRENIYLNGAMLGMRRHEINRKLDEIIAFGEIERFLDTPVKRYSSGMYVRLGFAVAAHLEPEILIVDEVLAVGDQQFQRKCLGKLNDVAESGRTVLFVSHNLAALQSLCRRGIVLHQGRVIQDAPISDSVQSYVAQIEERSLYDVAERSDRCGHGGVRLQRVEVHNLSNNSAPLTSGSAIAFVFILSKACPGLYCRFSIIDQHGHGIAKFNSLYRAPGDETAVKSSNVFVCRLDELLLAPGRYRIDVSLSDGTDIADSIDSAAMIEVMGAMVRGREPPRSRHDWKVFLPHRWATPD